MSSTTNKLLKSCSIFQDLHDEELNSLIKECNILNPKRGEILFSAGYPASHVFIVLMGSTKLIQANPDGKERIVHFMFRGDMFGAAVVMNGGFYPVSAKALEQSSILSIQKNIFSDIFLKHPIIGKVLISQMGERIMQAHHDRVNAYDSVEKRTAAFFLEILKKSRSLMGQTKRISIPLTRQDIADRIGSTVETVIRTLSQWEKDQFINSAEKYIDILNETALENIIGK